MNALNELMELHDAQVQVITIRDMEHALRIINAEYRARRTRPMVEKRDAASQGAT
jgi:hypothetical protein